MPEVIPVHREGGPAERAPQTRVPLGVVLAAVVLIGLSIAAYRWIDSLGGPRGVREHFGTTGLAVSLAAHWLVNVTPLGQFLPMAIGNGAIWGFWLGALVSWAGWIGASLTQYLVVRRLGTAFDVEARLERLPERIRRLPVEHAAFQVGGRSLPWVGLYLVNVTSAVRGVPLRRFLACAALGEVGPALTMAAVGAGMVALF